MASGFGLSLFVLLLLAGAACCLPDDSPTLTQTTSDVDKFEARLTLIEAEQRALRQQVNENTQRIHEMATGHVSFHARLDDNAHLNTGATLILNFVYSNEGGAYNATTGQFTAPVNGTYFFAATTSTYSSSQDANLYIAVDGVSMSYVGADRDASNMGACHLALPLRKGQRVWLEAWTDAYFYGTTTTFTGFLVASY